MRPTGNRPNYQTHDNFLEVRDARDGSLLGICSLDQKVQTQSQLHVPILDRQEAAFPEDVPEKSDYQIAVFECRDLNFEVDGTRFHRRFLLGRPEDAVHLRGYRPINPSTVR